MYSGRPSNRDERCVCDVRASLKQGRSGLGQGGKAVRHTGTPLAPGKLEGTGNFGKRILCAEVSQLVGNIVLLF